ncbi:MAG: antitoxin VapB family protein [Promethearchaeota archaeon]
MTSHQISIKKDVFNKLKEFKLKKESYSDTIERLLKTQGNTHEILDCFGIADEENDDFLSFFQKGKKILHTQMSNHFDEKIEK